MPYGLRLAETQQVAIQIGDDSRFSHLYIISKQGCYGNASWFVESYISSTESRIVNPRTDTAAQEPGRTNDI